MKIHCAIDSLVPNSRTNTPEEDPIVIEDADMNTDWVKIIVKNKGAEGYTPVYVNGDELIQAVKRCMNARWPYHG